MANGRSAGADDNITRPFELDLGQEVCDRATRLAYTLFGAVDAQVVLVQDGRAWRSRGAGGTQKVGPGVQAVLRSGQSIWVEDGRLDPRFADLPDVVGPPFARFYAASPIRLDDGVTAGVIAVTGVEARPYDSSLAGRLCDLAAFVADEWARVQAAKSREQGRRERDAALTIFKSVVEAMPVSLLITDTDLRVVGCSPRWRAEIGLNEGDVLGRSLAELRPELTKQCGDIFKRVLGGEAINDDRFRFRAADGTLRWISAELAPWRSASGEVGGMIASTHDVTDMVETLESSERSEQRLRVALEIADIHVYEMDYHRRELIKAGAEERFFTEPKTYAELYKDIYSSIDPRDRPGVESAWARHLELGEPFHPEYRVNRSDGRELWVAGVCGLVADQAGNALRLIGAMQDITERKKAEAALLAAKEDAEAANRAKSTFLATMSHEIRTPLNGVLGMAQAMSADALSPLQRDRLDVVRQSGETLLAILNDVLDLSKIEAGKLELEVTEFEVGALVRSTVSNFSAVAEQKCLSLDLEIMPDAPGIYSGDATRVRQILHNLISNALKFTEEGGVSVRISHDETGLRLRVSDSGIGIPADRLPSLFQKFEQVDASTTRRFGGTGLGLAISRELTRMLGGQVWAESMEGHGSTFNVSLPLPRVGEAPERNDQQPEDAGDAGGFPRLRVLAAEDNTVNQLVLKTLLTQAGIDPVIVSDGAQAVAAWEAREWDVILMDVQMPVLDGPGATREIRARECSLGRRRTPIVALTANAMAHQVSEYTGAGMDGFVAKPIEVSRLYRAIELALESGDQSGGEKPASALATSA